MGGGVRLCRWGGRRQRLPLPAPPPPPTSVPWAPAAAFVTGSKDGGMRPARTSRDTGVGGGCGWEASGGAAGKMGIPAGIGPPRSAHRWSPSFPPSHAPSLFPPPPKFPPVSPSVPLEARAFCPLCPSPAPISFCPINPRHESRRQKAAT